MREGNTINESRGIPVADASYETASEMPSDTQEQVLAPPADAPESIVAESSDIHEYRPDTAIDVTEMKPVDKGGVLPFSAAPAQADPVEAARIKVMRYILNKEDCAATVGELAEIDSTMPQDIVELTKGVYFGFGNKGLVFTREGLEYARSLEGKFEPAHMQRIEELLSEYKKPVISEDTKNGAQYPAPDNGDRHVRRTGTYGPDTPQRSDPEGSLLSPFYHRGGTHCLIRRHEVEGNMGIVKRLKRDGYLRAEGEDFRMTHKAEDRMLTGLPFD